MNIGTLTREQQQALSYTIVGPWLAYFLKDLCPSYDDFTTEFTTNSGLGPNLESCADDAPIIVDNGGTLESDAQINYQWYLNGIEIPNADQQTYAYTQSGTYQVASQVLGNCPSFSNEIMVQITGIVEADLLLLRNSGRTRISTNHELNNLTIEWFDLSGRMLDASSLPFVAKNGAIPVTEPDFMGVKLLRIRSNETVRTWKMW
jgi:hypothetical protein